MNTEKTKQFYVDKSGEYGDVFVSCINRRHKSSNKDMSNISVSFRGEKLLEADLSTDRIKFFPRFSSEEEINIINESLRQMDNFRSLMVLNDNDRWVVIVDGQKVPFVKGLEAFFYRGSLFAVVHLCLREGFKKTSGDSMTEDLKRAYAKQRRNPFLAPRSENR